MMSNVILGRSSDGHFELKIYGLLISFFCYAVRHFISNIKNPYIFEYSCQVSLKIWFDSKYWINARKNPIREMGEPGN